MKGDELFDRLDDPEELENFYRSDPEGFALALEKAAERRPDSLLIRAWRARLSAGPDPNRFSWSPQLGIAIVVGVLSGGIVRIPAALLDPDWYLPRFAPSAVLLGVAAYFWTKHRDQRHMVAGLILAVGSAIYVAVLPSDGDSVVMALLHLPVLFWALLGIVFMGSDVRDSDARIRFVRYNGELLILASLIGLGGMVFSGVTVALFSLIAEGMEEWYFENIGLFGVAAVPVAATYLYDVVFNRRTGIAAVLARVFAPLFLAMATTYVAVALGSGQNPFMDRSFLITFNGLVVVVLGITILTIAERDHSGAVGITDYINLSLIVVTLLMDAIALSAILFRLVSYGFTPNRVVVLGANVIAFVHLVWMGWAYMSLIRRRLTPQQMEHSVTGYLIAYVIWAAVVAFLLPVAFGFA